MIKMGTYKSRKPFIWQDDMVEVREMFRRVNQVKKSAFTGFSMWGDGPTAKTLSRNRLRRRRAQYPLDVHHLNYTESPYEAVTHLHNIQGMCTRIHRQEAPIERKKKDYDLELLPSLLRRPLTPAFSVREGSESSQRILQNRPGSAPSLGTPLQYTSPKPTTLYDATHKCSRFKEPRRPMMGRPLSTCSFGNYRSECSGKCSPCMASLSSQSSEDFPAENCNRLSLHEDLIKKAPPVNLHEEPIEKAPAVTLHESPAQSYSSTLLADNPLSRPPSRKMRERPILENDTEVYQTCSFGSVFPEERLKVQKALASASKMKKSLKPKPGPSDIYEKNFDGFLLQNSSENPSLSCSSSSKCSERATSLTSTERQSVSLEEQQKIKFRTAWSSIEMSDGSMVPISVNASKHTLHRPVSANTIVPLSANNLKEVSSASGFSPHAIGKELERPRSAITPPARKKDASLKQDKASFSIGEEGNSFMQENTKLVREDNTFFSEEDNTHSFVTNFSTKQNVHKTGTLYRTAGEGSHDRVEMEKLTSSISFDGSSNVKNGADDSHVVIKHSADPYQDFKSSMLQMIREENLQERPTELDELFQYYLDLNPVVHHEVLRRVIYDIRNQLKYDKKE